MRWIEPLLLLGFAVGCGRTPPPAEGPVYVRGGVIAPATGIPGEQLLADGRALVLQEWKGTPGAPLMAECVPLYQVPLGDVSKLVAMGGAAPDTTMAFSPTGDRLAIGSYGGEIVVVDGWNGAVRARRVLSESMVKHVAWSVDGTVLYAAEQSPDANVYALDPADLSTRWTLRLADFVESSAPPPADDLYGVYTLPSAYGLDVLANGDLVLGAVHAWNVSGEERRNRSQLLRVDASGAVVARWPEEPGDITLMHPRVDRAGGLIAVPVGRSATGPPPTDLPINGLQVLRLDDLSPVVAFSWKPLAPYFASVFLWEAVAVDGTRDTVIAGLTDGRLFEHGLSGAPRWQQDIGTPVISGELPIAASVGHAVLHQGQVIALTSGTTIPYGTVDPALRPPAPHPNANAVWMFDTERDLHWTWTGLHDVHGLSLHSPSDTLVVGAGPRRADERRDLYGALVFDLSVVGPDESGLAAFCATEGPVFFHQEIAGDGRIAVAEFPYQDSNGSQHGAYRVTVLR